MRPAALALALLLTACSGRDRYLPEFEPATVLTQTNGPVTFAVGPDDRIYFAELRTNTLFVLDRRTPKLLFVAPHRPDSLVVAEDGAVYVATRTKKHRVRIYRGQRLLWEGPVSRFPAHLAIDERDGVIVGLGKDVMQLDPRRVISTGWTDPIVTPGRGDRLWVADNKLPGDDERVARGREQNVAKRNRFASALPPDTNPIGMALVDDQLLLCSRTHREVYRMHIGIDDVARRRGWMKDLVCERGIAVDSQGGLVTATRESIYYYRQR